MNNIKLITRFEVTNWVLNDSGSYELKDTEYERNDVSECLLDLDSVSSELNTEVRAYVRDNFCFGDKVDYVNHCDTKYHELDSSFYLIKRASLKYKRYGIDRLKVWSFYVAKVEIDLPSPDCRLI